MYSKFGRVLVTIQVQVLLEVVVFKLLLLIYVPQLKLMASHLFPQLLLVPIIKNNNINNHHIRILNNINNNNMQNNDNVDPSCTIGIMDSNNKNNIGNNCIDITSLQSTNNRNTKPILISRTGSTRISITPSIIQFKDSYSIQYKQSIVQRLFVSKSIMPYNKRQYALYNITIQLNPYELIIVTGASNSGKSTLFQSILVNQHWNQENYHQDTRIQLQKQQSTSIGKIIQSATTTGYVYCGTVPEEILLSSSKQDTIQQQVRQQQQQQQLQLQPKPIYIDRLEQKMLHTINDNRSVQDIINQDIITIFKQQQQRKQLPVDTTISSSLIQSIQTLVQYLANDIFHLFIIGSSEIQIHNPNNQDSTTSTNTGSKNSKLTLLNQLSISEVYRFQLLRSCLHSMVSSSLLASSETVATTVSTTTAKSGTDSSSSFLTTNFPAPILLIDELLDNEPTTIILPIQQSLQRLVHYTGAVCCIITHKPQRFLPVLVRKEQLLSSSEIYTTTDIETTARCGSSSINNRSNSSNQKCLRHITLNRGEVLYDTYYDIK